MTPQARMPNIDPTNESNLKLLQNQFHFNISQIWQPPLQERPQKLIESNIKISSLRAFKADHNVLTELPYDFSQLLQNFDTKNVTLEERIKIMFQNHKNFGIDWTIYKYLDYIYCLFNAFVLS